MALDGPRSQCWVREALASRSYDFKPCLGDYHLKIVLMGRLASGLLKRNVARLQSWDICAPRFHGLSLQTCKDYKILQVQVLLLI